ncbi:antibiotic biosynthesis monooxygenase [Acinetobacter sp. ANC 5054]|uniref:antibiotic biosynthesis monooxygenase family protein n=1 Tax=Acinetobacter sp. ANC 5054 TaxID=1977877 RepID=UPI000A32E4AF|nr:antibiotic biosynthesis monooxygenase [Acinetobacter sp. ANC 5054]OTG81281.1 antibiotic biosynthesis monooxygenase [Acinetobacter sp. ANC 5054]
MKYVVIFKAKIRNLDEQYFQTANMLREKALGRFNCQHFEAWTEGQKEIALSYWNSLADIQAWHHDAEHQVAQQHGKTKWYAHFSVEICEILRQYRN